MRTLLEPALRQTPLAAAHRALGARLVDFAGWEMPVQYGGIIEEHLAVRQAAGLFDVSHMGRLLLRGAAGEALLQRTVTRDVGRLGLGEMAYTALCREDGGVLDDLIVGRGREGFFVVCNASNRDTVREWLLVHADDPECLVDVSDEWALLGLQGPRAEALLQPVCDAGLAAMPYLAFTEGVRVAGSEAIVTRTGYTAEDGFEIWCRPADAERTWQALLDAGAAPCGLGARDSLRLEACYPLYGHDMDETVNPLEAAIPFVVDWEKDDFIGRATLEECKARGLTRRLAALLLDEPGVPRHGYAVRVGDAEVGRITSGGHSPTLRRAIALAMLETPYWKRDSAVQVDIRGRAVRAHTVRMPFYRGSVKAGQ